MIRGITRAAAPALVGPRLAAAWILSSPTGRMVCTGRWHEMQPCHFAHSVLRTLHHFAFMQDVNDSECLLCPTPHLIHSDEACRRQDPSSTYGN
jgi:hypothetical protein